MKSIVILLLSLVCILDGIGVYGISTYYLDRQCGSSINLPSVGRYDVRLKLTSRLSYHSGLNCTVYITANQGERMMVYFDTLNIYSSTYCTKDVLMVLDGNSLSSYPVNGLQSRVCGYSRPPRVYTTSGKDLTVNFQSHTSTGSGFTLIITRYTIAPCFSREYNCDNGRCIDNTLTCNGYNPCGDHSDCPIAAGAIAGIVVGCFFFFVIAITIVILLRRRRRMRFRGGVTTIQTSPSYGSANNGYNQPVSQPYPTGQAPPPQQPSYQ